MEEQITYDNIIRERERVLNDGLTVDYIQLTEDAIESLTKSVETVGDGTSNQFGSKHVAALDVETADTNRIVTETGETFGITGDS